MNKVVPIRHSCTWAQLLGRPWQLECTRMFPTTLTNLRNTLKNDESRFGLFTLTKRAYYTLYLVQVSLINPKNSWFCFHTGRPSSLSLKDVAIDVAQDPFIRLLAELCKTITRSSDEIYGQRHESLLHMWKVARTIADDLRGHEAHMRQALGIGLDSSIQTGSLWVRQTIFTSRKKHTDRLLALI